MPRLTLNVTNITRSAVATPTETNGDTVNQHQVPNDGRTFLLVRNAGATVARTLTIIIQGAIDGFAPVPRTYSIPISSSRYIGPFDPAIYGSMMQVNVDNAELKLSAFNI